MGDYFLFTSTRIYTTIDCVAPLTFHTSSRKISLLGSFTQCCAHISEDTTINITSISFMGISTEANTMVTFSGHICIDICYALFGVKKKFKCTNYKNLFPWLYKMLAMPNVM